MTSPELSHIDVEGTTRAAFLARATLTAGALVGVGALTPFVSGALAQGNSGDVEILNFALTLEHLEAAFYAQALKAVPGLSGEARTLATEFASNEAEHVGVLQATIKHLGGTPVKRPGVKFGGAFASEQAFLRVAAAFEDAGVSAYNGAAPMISSKAVLGAAGSIVQVEARHAALIRMRLGRTPSPDAFEKPATKAATLAAVKPYLAS